MLAAEFGTGEVFLTITYFFFFALWIWLLITVYADIFTSPDLSGGAKALWSIFVLVMPYLGIFVYIIARGHHLSPGAIDAPQQGPKVASA